MIRRSFPSLHPQLSVIPRANARLVRYADDFVILAKYVGGRLEQFVAQTLQDWMELKVNPSAKSEDSASTSPT